MTEEKHNKLVIKNKLKDVCQDCTHLDKIVPIVREMLSEQYIAGLEQGRFDFEMDLMTYNTELLEENKNLKQKDYDHFGYLKRIDNLEKQLEIGEEQYKELEETNNNLIEENAVLQNNWNELENYIKQEIYNYNNDITIKISNRPNTLQEILSKMKEIEEGK